MRISHCAGGQDRLVFQASTTVIAFVRRAASGAAVFSCATMATARILLKPTGDAAVPLFGVEMPLVLPMPLQDGSEVAQATTFCVGPFRGPFACWRITLSVYVLFLTFAV